MTPALEPADVELVKRLRAEAQMYGYGQDNPQRVLSEAASRIEALAHQLGEMQRALEHDLNVTDEELLRIRNSCEGNDYSIKIWARMLQKLVDSIRAARAALRTASGDGDGR